jgi:outer membrane immunogenic protein
MQKLVIAAIALISLAGPAVAGGLEPSDDAQSAWSFTGYYAGGHAGGLWGSSEKWIVRTQGGAFEGQSVGEHDLNGWIGGIQAGCDYQTAGGFVIGVQGDYGWSNDDGTHASAREIGVFYHSEIESLASVTGRVGYAFDRFLGYVKGGAAWERDTYSASTIIVGTAYTTSDTRSGMDDWRRWRICHQQVSVRLCRVQLFRLRHDRHALQSPHRGVAPSLRRH